MSLVDKMLPIIDKLALALPNKFGLRKFRVYLRQTTWTGARVGMGTKSAIETELTVFGGAPPEVSQLKTQEVLSSGGKYKDGDFKIGPFAPFWTDSQGNSGGYNAADLDPPNDGAPTEIAYRIVDTRGGLDDYASLIESHLDSSFGYTLIVRLQHTRGA